MWSTRKKMEYDQCVKNENSDIVKTIRDTLSLTREGQKESSSSSNNWSKLMSLVKLPKPKWNMEK